MRTPAQYITTRNMASKRHSFRALPDQHFYTLTGKGIPLFGSKTETASYRGITRVTPVLRAPRDRPKHYMFTTHLLSSVMGNVWLRVRRDMPIWLLLTPLEPPNPPLFYIPVNLSLKGASSCKGVKSPTLLSWGLLNRGTH